MRSTKREDAERTLRKRLQAKDDGLPVDPQIGKLRFEEAAKDLINDYKVNAQKSLDEAQRRVEKHLTPAFGGRKLANITTADVRAFIATRQAETSIVRRAYTVKQKDGSIKRIPEERRTIAGVSNAEINRELTLLKRIFNLAIQANKILHKPYIPLLREDNTRTGFFELEQFRSVLAHLPAEIQPIVAFAHITGWRIASEVLSLQWRQVDFKSGEVRLDAGTTKNTEGRVFVMSDDLRRLLEARHLEHERLKKAGHICPYVFFRLVADERGGEKKPRQIKAFAKAWT